VTRRFDQGGSNDPVALCNRGVAAHRDGRLEEAEAHYRAALALAPDDPDVLLRLGTVLAAQATDEDTFDDAIAYLRAAAERSGPADASNGELYSNYGNALRLAGRRDKAVEVLRDVVRASPRSWQPWHNLGQVYKELDRTDEAAAALRRAVALQPADAASHAVLGEVLFSLGRLNSSVASLQRAINLGLYEFSVMSRLGIVYRQLGELAKSEVVLREVADALPNDASANSNLAVVLAQSGQFDEAQRYHTRAVELAPDNLPVITNRAYARLTAGDIPGAWADWERAIEDGPRGKLRAVELPRWRGEPLGSQRLLVYREQGVGDEIMFASCYPDAIASSASVVIETDHRVAPLFARSFPEATVRGQTVDIRGGETLAEPDFDITVPAGSLPVFFRSTVASFPDRRSFLVPDPVQVAAWQDRLAPIGTGADGSARPVRVGFSWRSKLNTAERRLEYTRLAEWGEIFGIQNVEFFNLQYDECEQELHDAERRFDVRIHRWADVDYMNDFDAVAALMVNLDLVISPRSAVAMLAGALGVPTLMMGNRWAWADLGTDRFPWFPAVTLVYRHLGEEWDGVLAMAAARVRHLAEPFTTNNL
jgi:Flp pilus assembly protein TadD